MRSVTYKISPTGCLSAWRGRQRLDEVWGELPMSLPERRRLRDKLPRTLVRANLAVFGRRCVPNDFEDLRPLRRLLAQVDSDNPRLLPLAHALAKDDIKPTPAHSFVQRMKKAFMKQGLKSSERTGGYSMPHERKTMTEVDRFWDGYHQDNAPLTEAGWRYLCKLPLGTQRVLAAQPWAVKECFDLLNQLAILDVPALDAARWVSLSKLARVLVDADNQKNFLLAYRQALLAGHDITAEEEDFLYDLFRSDRELVIHPGKAWNTLVHDAAEFMARTAEASRDELQALQWSVPAAPFDTPEGVTVRLLCNGVELLEEGIELKNCLRNMTHYAERATRGECHIAALRGPVKGTAEFILNAAGRWEVLQVAAPCNQQVRSGMLWNAAQSAVQRINGGAR